MGKMHLYFGSKKINALIEVFSFLNCILNAWAELKLTYLHCQRTVGKKKQNKENKDIFNPVINTSQYSRRSVKAKTVVALF